MRLEACICARTPILYYLHGGVISRKLLTKSRNQNIFEKFQLNRNLQRIPFKMMYNMSMLRHRFSNECWGGGGGGGALNHLPFLFCKSVFKFRQNMTNYIFREIHNGLSRIMKSKYFRKQIFQFSSSQVLK